MSALPHPHILEKIQSLHPEGPENIMSRMERIATARRAGGISSQVREALSPAQIFGALAKGIFLSFGGGEPSPRPPVAIPYGNDRVALSNDWIAVGNDLKRAITEYMAENGLDEDTLELTAQERESLKILSPVPLPAPPSPT